MMSAGMFRLVGPFKYVIQSAPNNLQTRMSLNLISTSSNAQEL